MICSCGGESTTGKAVQKGLELRYSECRRCGRAGFWVLYRGGDILLMGEDAKRAFDHLRARSELPADSKAEEPAAHKEAPGERGEQLQSLEDVLSAASEAETLSWKGWHFLEFGVELRLYFREPRVAPGKFAVHLQERRENAWITVGIWQIAQDEFPDMTADMAVMGTLPRDQREQVLHAGQELRDAQRRYVRCTEGIAPRPVAADQCPDEKTEPTSRANVSPSKTPVEMGQLALF